MHLSKKLLAPIVGIVLLASQSFPATAQPAQTAQFQWAGPYISAYTGYGLGWFGTRLGFGIARDRLVASVEAGAGLASLIGFVELRGRVGLLVRPNILAYYYTGFIANPGLALSVFTIGGGVEFAFARDLSIFADAGGVRPIGGPPIFTPMLHVGINWRPQN